MSSINPTLWSIKDSIDKDFKKPCKHFDISCYQCQVYMAFKVIHDYVKFTPPFKKVNK